MDGVAAVGAIVSAAEDLASLIVVSGNGGAQMPRLRTAAAPSVAALALAEGALPSRLRLELPQRAAWEALLRRAGCVPVQTLGALVDAAAALAMVRAPARRDKTAAPPPEVTPMNIEGSGIMDEHEAKKLLGRWDIPVVPETLVTGPGRHEFTPIRKLATHFTFPVVLKAVREDIVHKAELGAVVVGVPNVNELAKVWEQMHERFPDAAWLVQPYLPGDLEVIVAAQRHPVLGAVVSVGPGGIMRDLYGDVAARAAPLSMDDALEMVDQTKLADLLRGFRGLPPHDSHEVADVLVKVGWLMLGQPQVQELEIGPLLLTEKGPIAVDAKAAIG